MADLVRGRKVVLKSAPSALLNGLPEEDQIAIRAIVGRPVLLAAFRHGQAELEFTDSAGDEHTIWVEPDLLQAV
jgi:hypothetical protein